jgi:hypothetical protein
VTATRVLLVFSTAALLAACRADAVPNGAWGGDHVLLTVTDNGGRVEFNCAHGTLDHPLRLDDAGRFNVVGTFAPEHAGPVLQPEDNRPARYAGRIDRDKIEFTVTLEGQTGRGPYTVALAKKPKLQKCR